MEEAIAAARAAAMDAAKMQLAHQATAQFDQQELNNNQHLNNNTNSQTATQLTYNSSVVAEPQHQHYEYNDYHTSRPAPQDKFTHESAFLNVQDVNIHNNTYQQQYEPKESVIQRQLLKPPSRPEETVLTIAQDGTIFGATEMHTGFPVNSILMTSAYDTVHPQDLIVLRAVVTQFWECGHSGVTAYIRRRTVEDIYIWVVCQLQEYITTPVPGVVVKEVVIKDVANAEKACRITRVAALLTVTMETEQRETKIDESQQHEINNDDSFESIIDLVRAGTCLDLSKFHLSRIELTLVGHVLSGRIQKEDLKNLIISTIGYPAKDIAPALKIFIDRKETLRRRHEEMQRPRVEIMVDQSHKKRYSNQGAPLAFVESKHLRRPSVVHYTPVEEPKDSIRTTPPHLAVLNLSYCDIGSKGMEVVSEAIYTDNPFLKTLDLSFCGLDERGILILCRALAKRKKRRSPLLHALILSGNTVTYKAAKELGVALSSGSEENVIRKRRMVGDDGTGYDEDDEWEESDDDGDEVPIRPKYVRPKRSRVTDVSFDSFQGGGLRLLHLACCSLSANSFHQLLLGLGQDSTIRELSVPSNNIGPGGASLLVSFLDGSSIAKFDKSRIVMPKLDRLDLSNNELGNDGVAVLTRAIAKRSKMHFKELKLSSNEIGSLGIETIMNKLFQQNLVSLCLDNNSMGDKGCQLIAASLPSMHSMTQLSLSFNQVGTRGITSLMRALLGCDSMTRVGLSGNALKVQGAVAMGFMLAQHPRIEHLELDNCCLSQVAQCHIAAGMISNRWVPMKTLNGFKIAPALVAMGAMDILAQNLSNDECFQVRRDIQMRSMLQWMQAKNELPSFENDQIPPEMLVEVLSRMNSSKAEASESAYVRMLDWLSCIPFDEDELVELQVYFFEVESNDNAEVVNDMDAVLKHRGDLLANLTSDDAKEIRDINQVVEVEYDPERPIGLPLYELQKERFVSASDKESMDAKARELEIQDELNRCSPSPEKGGDLNKRPLAHEASTGGLKRTKGSKSGIVGSMSRSKISRASGIVANLSVIKSQSSAILSGNKSATSVHSVQSTGSCSSSKRRQARILMFPQFQAKLEDLKADAQHKMDNEYDPEKQDIIAQQFAEASLTLLRQLRYHCMNSGFDGWRTGKMKKKVLIVDDSVITRKMVARAFKKANFIVDTAEDGKEGVEKLKNSIYDVAFMDIDMPVMNGFDATKTLRAWEDKNRPGVRQPICALTASYVDDFERSELMKYKEAGLDLMESKPCNIPRLFKVVDDVSPMFSDLTINGTTTCTNASSDAAY